MNTEISNPPLSTPKNIALAIAQIFLWGGSFFILSVLADPIIKETLWSQQIVYGVLSLSLLVCGLVSAKVGRIINETGRSQVLLLSAIVMAFGLIIIGFAYQLWIFALGWVIIGIAMAMGLYDALFAFLGKVYGQQASRSIVQITLISGFAPTVSWLLISHLLNYFEWRTVCFIYAGALAVFIAPLNYFVFRKDTISRVDSGNKSAQTKTPKNLFNSKIFHLLQAYFTIGAVLMTGIAVHLIDILINSSMSLDGAVGIAALLGPSQVGVRLLDLILPIKSPEKKAIISAVAIFVGLFILLTNTEIAIVGVIIFGLGNGWRSILKGTLPLYIFGQKDYAAIMGKLASLPVIAQATTPFIGGVILHQYSASIFISFLVMLAYINILLIFYIQKTISSNSQSHLL